MWTATATAALLLFVLQLLAQLLYGLHVLPTAHGQVGAAAPLTPAYAPKQQQHGTRLIAPSSGSHVAGAGGQLPGQSQVPAASAALLSSSYDLDDDVQQQGLWQHSYSDANSTAVNTAAVVLEALGLGSMEGLPVGYILLVRCC